MDQDAINEQEWLRPENWKGRLGMYSSARDTRIWVPKRRPALGWTVNMAHRGGRLSLLGLLTVPLGLVVLLVLLQFARKPPAFDPSVRPDPALRRLRESGPRIVDPELPPPPQLEDKPPPVRRQ
jgi:hypothetical protein